MGCIAHNLNLIIGDIIKLKWSADILKDAKAIVKYFRNHQVPAAILKRHQKTIRSINSLKYPVKTRWRSAATCLNSILTNQLALELTSKELSRTSITNYPEEICDTIDSKDFWRNVQDLLIILDKLVAGISIFESDTSQLALFYQWFHEQLTCNGMYYL